ncbi:uncharacterized protein LOC143634063 [Bidens hawaiensis]|uniref:uncharacterized protein LOC143634063 n=1 Tax=Bidens hawaiensis TaxID=980011 RepID=UPI00404A6472
MTVTKGIYCVFDAMEAPSLENGLLSNTSRQCCKSRIPRPTSRSSDPYLGDFFQVGWNSRRQSKSVKSRTSRARRSKVGPVGLGISKSRERCWSLLGAIIQGSQFLEAYDSAQAFSAHTSLFCFTLLLVLKLHHLISYSWWVVFFPLFLFHVTVARRTSSSRGPFIFHGLYVAPHRVPFLIVFELLLYVFLQNSFLSLKIVFLPLLAFEAAIFYDNFRMCKALLSEHDEILSDAIWQALPVSFTH